MTENGAPVHRFRLSRAGSERAASRRSCSRSTPRAACRASRSPTRSPPRGRSRCTANPHQPLAIVTFDDKVNVLQPFTTDPSKIAAALRKIADARAGHEDLRRARPEPRADRRRRIPHRRRSCCSPTAPTSAASRSRPPCSRRSRAAHAGCSRSGSLERVRSADARPRRRRERRLVRPRQPAVRAAAGSSPRSARGSRASTSCATGTVVPAGQRVAVKVAVQGLPPATASYVAPRLVFKAAPPYTLSSTRPDHPVAARDGARRRS